MPASVHLADEAPYREGGRVPEGIREGLARLHRIHRVNVCVGHGPEYTQESQSSCRPTGHQIPPIPRLATCLCVPPVQECQGQGLLGPGAQDPEVSTSKAMQLRKALLEDVMEGE
jgi:hypothetical protein